MSKLKFGQKMLLPTAVAALALLLAILVSYFAGQRTQQLMDQVERGDVPAWEISHELEEKSLAIQRGMQDAVAAEDPAELEKTDAIRDQLLEQAAAARSNPAFAKDAAALIEAFESYYALARPTSARLAQGEHSEELAGKVAEMAQRYTALKAELDQAAGDHRREAELAFERVRTVSRSSLLLSLVIMGLAMATSMSLTFWLVRSTNRPLQSLTLAARRAAQGDLTSTIEVLSQDELGELAASFGTMVGQLRQIIATLQSSSGELTGASAALNRLTDTQLRALQEQAAGLTQTSATTAELQQASALAAGNAESVLAIARQADVYSRTGQTSAEQSLEGLEQIRSRVEAIAARSVELGQRAEMIGNIIDSVRDLADQSHVLSLNASIEAARAGESGKGFAVVASEMRKLAEQSLASARQVATIVQEIQGAIHGTVAITEEGNRSMGGSLEKVRASGDSLREIGAIASKTAEAATQIASAVKQQNTGIEQIASSVTELNRAMQDTLSEIQGVTAATSRLDSMSSQIAEIVQQFRV